MSDDTTPTTRIYHGSTTADGDRRVTMTASETGNRRNLNPHHAPRNHSPTDFN